MFPVHTPIFPFHRQRTRIANVIKGTYDKLKVNLPASH